MLFLELVCIRWLPAHVLFLTFFTNTVLLACFLGMSIGCMIAERRRNFIVATPFFLLVTFAAAHVVEAVRNGLEQVLDVGHQASPELVFFGTEYRAADVAKFPVPIELLAGAFFVLVALAFVGLGQELGRALALLPDRIAAYTANVLGSVAGIAIFTGASWLELSPFWWMLAGGAVLAYFVWPHNGAIAALAAVLGLVALTCGAYKLQARPGEHHWSPYYRVDYDSSPIQRISVNLIGHQQMRSHDDPYVAYDLPYLLRRDSGGAPFENVLVIGAGSGNDVSHALAWGAKHVDAVEIDPVIQRLGATEHPDRPYSDPRAVVHLDDGRNFLRRTTAKYDLVVYALVDSLVLHSSLSNIRLESYLFTTQALEDVRAHLAPGGLFVMYNYFRQGWIVSRLRAGLENAFKDPPLVFTLPYMQTVRPSEAFSGFTVLVSGATHPLADAFAKNDAYWLRRGLPASSSTPSGFEQHPDDPSAWERIGLAQVVAPEGALEPATDDWPFLYLRGPMIPTLSLRGVAVMGALSLLLLFLFRPRGSKGALPEGTARMFFLGAGFMLVETRAVVTMAACFGSTWVVNSVVFLAILAMILAGNVFVARVRPVRSWPAYAGLFVSLLVSAATPIDAFLGLPRAIQMAGASLVVFAPIFFAGIVFAVAFRRMKAPHTALAANVAGAILGGLLENASMLIGFRYLALLGLVLYALSGVRSALRSSRGVRRPAADHLT